MSRFTFHEFFSVHFATKEMTSINVDHLQLMHGFHELYTHPTLQNADLALNARLGLFICMECKIALPKTRVKKHGEEKHAWEKETQSAVALFVREHCADVHTKYPPTAFSEPVKSFEGLPVVNDYFGCPHCVYAAQQKGIKVHIKTCVKDAVKSNEPPKANISAQTYSAQNNQSWFQVISTNDASSGSVVIPHDQLHIQSEAGVGVDDTASSVSHAYSLVANRTLKNCSKQSLRGSMDVSQLDQQNQTQSVRNACSLVANRTLKNCSKQSLHGSMDVSQLDQLNETQSVRNTFSLVANRTLKKCRRTKASCMRWDCIPTHPNKMRCDR